ncbi:ABA4-like family protein [Altericista sp. CCNU0014]|uniref:ABA4-like family protein n=1 Tax=Altericista sp. CCNU0014 TaxID=3082949 RepID=UPI00384B7595
MFALTTLTSDSAQSFANPTLSDVARLFSDEKAAATGWVHYLVMDLFVGRWIYWEGQRTGVWTRHSLVFCLFAGPMGLLSHIVTAAIAQKWFSSSQETEPEIASTEG